MEHKHVLKKIEMLAVSLLLSCTSLLCQIKIENFDVTIYARKDTYEPFVTTRNNYIITHTIFLKGNSFGVDLAKKYLLAKNLNLRPALGYFRYGFKVDETINSNSGRAPIPSRPINYTSRAQLTFSAFDYAYNCLALNLGVDYTFHPTKKVDLKVGAEVKNFFSVFNYYHINDDPEDDDKFRKWNLRYFATSFLGYSAALFQVGNFKVGPTFSIPIYDVWKTDQQFLNETNTNKREKRFHGFAIGMSTSYTPLNKIL